NGSRYRVHRSTGVKGGAATQLERYDAQSGQWVPEADRARDANAYIERVLGMDFEAFTRSVLLPQGQFHQFVAGRPEERSEVLNEILRLDVYGRMVRAANELASREKNEEARIGELLAGPLADATPENLREKQRLLKELDGHAKAASRLKQALAEASELAASLARLREQHGEASGQAERAERQLTAARSLLESGQEDMRQLEQRIKEVEKALGANQYDDQLYARLSAARVAAEGVQALQKREADLERTLAEKQQTLQKAEASCRQARKKEEAAGQERERCEAALREMERHHAAAYLLQNLKVGDPCPVCNKPLMELPEFEAGGLKQARAALERTKSAEEAARRAATQAESQFSARQTELAAAEESLQQCREDLSGRLSSLQELAGGTEISFEQIQAALAAQTQAREEKETLERERQELQSESQTKATQLATAAANLTRFQEELERCQKVQGSLEDELAKGEADLRRRASEQGWPDIAQALQESADVKPLFERQLRDCEREVASLQEQIGATRSEIAAIQRGIEQARELRERQETARKQAANARELAGLLQANNFQAYIREHALRILAEDGSRHLNDLSRGRYNFAVAGQDFDIVDHWNGNEPRSVKTLSGGETFLASLALALALAERLPELGARGGRASLESLFIDEGFSNLDGETLDVVATALEVLGGDGQRMVGVITHLPALAERMPARIIVQKSEAGSRLVKE
ncbi:MAG TPA: SMC family ATPase, partial [Dehalococcoidia bacterium]|nr:SMC family ATPase [Dehalococcoidia bacterium]